MINNKIFDNIDKIECGIGHQLALIISAISTALCGIIASFIINWQLTLILLCILPLIIIATRLFSKMIINETMKELNSYSKAGRIAQEVFSSIRTVTSLNGAKFEQKRYEKELSSTSTISIRKGAIYGIFVGWLSLQLDLIYGIGFIFGSILMNYLPIDHINIGSIIIVVIAFAQGLSFIISNSPFLQSIFEAQGAAYSVYRLIDQNNEININEDIWTNPPIDNQLINISENIQFENVHFQYPSRKNYSILNNLNLFIRHGKTTALVGLSGSGKSTCFSLLLRFYEPSSGYIKINQQSINEIPRKKLRKLIGIVSQESILFSTTIYENIRYGKLNATKEDIEQSAKQANAHEFINQLPDKYLTLVGEGGVQLSGGERQRIVLARILIKKPQLLLLDEATSSLDGKNENIIQDALHRVSKDRTTIIIAHRLKTIINADYIYVLDKGNIIEEGTHQTLMENQTSKYKQMIEAQQLIEHKYEKNDENTVKIQDENIDQSDEYNQQLNESEHDHIDNKSNDGNIFIRLLLLNRTEWIIICLSCVACLFSGISQTIYAILLTEIVKSFKYCTYNERQTQINLFSFCFLLLGLFALVNRFVQFTCFAYSGSKLTKRIRLKAFSSYLRQEIAYFDRPENNSGAICSSLSTDALSIQQITGIRLGIICETFSMLCFGFLIGFYFNSKLTIVVCIPLIIIFLMASTEIVLQMRFNKHMDIILKKANSLIGEVFDNIRTVKELTIEEEFFRQYSILVNQWYIIRRNSLLISSLLFGFYWTSNIYISGIVYWYALTLFENNQLANDKLLIVFAFATFFSRSMQVFLVLTGEIGASLSSVRRFFDLFDRIPSIDNCSDQGLKLTNFRGKIDFTQVKFAYPSRPSSYILKNFNLTINPGDRIAIVGSSGGGKSTLIQLLERFYDVTNGRVSFDDIDIRKLNIQWIRSLIGLVHQQPILFNMTIYENISYGIEHVSMDDVINVATKANIHQFIMQLPKGYDTMLGFKGNQISGGEKQRLVIARALLRQPKLLLLDEATSAMDSYNEQIVQQTIENIQNTDLNITSLVIAHRLSTIRSCHFICVLDQGEIIESGTYDQLMQQRGIYYSMEMQLNIFK